MVLSHRALVTVRLSGSFSRCLAPKLTNLRRIVNQQYNGNLDDFRRCPSTAGQHVINENCIKDCSAEPKDTVCGNNKITYDNECLLKVASCYARAYWGQTISVKHKGACTLAETSNPEVLKHCNDLCDEFRDFICASDGVVYDNKCNFERAKCEAAMKNNTLFIVTLADTCPQTRKVSL
ncbi:protease inhibitor protein [Elysia marginata]|uniref:Protease inhibitor protein n=1 Tax=Elysia marginata TaxID=1093978 RepID=A0AAV4GUD9_9GAST|nr:protease inhibitor protein [Elysia marginata]